MGPLFDSGCWGSGIGERDWSGRRRECGRDAGLGRGEEAGPVGHGGEDGWQMAGAAQRQRRELRRGGRKLLELGERTGPGPPHTGTVGGTEPESGAGGGRQRPGTEGGRSVGQTAGSGSVAERPLQCGTEVGAGGEEDRTEGEWPGPRSASGASRFGFGAEEAEFGYHSGLTRSGFGSGTQRSGRGFGAETPEDESGAARPGSGRSEVQCLANNLEFVLKLLEPRGLEPPDG